MLEQLWIPHLSPYLAAGPNTTLFTRPDHLTGLQCRLIFRGTWAVYVHWVFYLYWATLDLGANRALILILKHRGKQKKRSNGDGENKVLAEGGARTGVAINETSKKKVS